MAPSELEEERRLFYVGMTRAKKNYIFHILKRYEEKAEPSRFVDELLGLPQEKDFQINTPIFHQKYGEGIIKKKKGPIIEVRFKDYWKIKKIDLQYCLQEKLITVTK